MKRDDLGLDRLLSGGNLGGPAYDWILGRVLERTEERRPARAVIRWAPRALVAGGALAAALGAWLLIARPKPPDQTFRPKGASLLVPTVVDVGCAHAGRIGCRLGDTLMFKVNGGGTAGYLGAYAVREDDPLGERIWYFPTAGGESPFVAAGSEAHVLPEGIRIGSEHQPARYRVSVWIASRPLARAEAEAARQDVIESRATFHFEVDP